MIADAQSELERAVRFLAKRDPALSDAVKRFGIPKARRRPAGFSTLAKIIVGQQISTKAADAIWNRCRSTLGTVNAQAVRAAKDADLRAAGLSASKLKTLKAIAAAAETGTCNFRGFNRKTDDEVKTHLTAIWGIGDWTADIYLMFGMGRPDVWPVGDLALRTGWQAISESASRIEAKDLAALAEHWSPHRSAAAVLLWHAVAVTRA
ncbi:MAG: DNA-3-methyladenine glycosylase 2 family protein [Alphaproteobacteria bacterium]|nr:DNA-3-methyladenine glycosylase 2 family protein [Alphaproteobacteria bacterium]